MKAFLAVIVVAALSAAPGPAQEMEFPKPVKEHEWLKQLAGEWDADVEMVSDPTKPPDKMKGTESTRMIGGFWAMCEKRGKMGDKEFTGILTLGYDAEKKKYVGTWIDSLFNYLWTYEGTVDAAGKKLTLLTQGPAGPGGPLTKFEETIEIKDKDHKSFSSAIEQNGKLVTFMTINYTRKK